MINFSTSHDGNDKSGNDKSTLPFRTFLVVILCFVLSVMLAGCGGSGSAQTDTTDTDSDRTAAAEEADEKTGANGIDVDLTTLSSTMVYSEVNDMMIYPDNYKGKIVKMKGPSSSFHDEEKDKYYFACIIEDATACCQQGIEYELSDDYDLPDDYPDDEEEITVVGTFDTYKEGDATYCILKNATLL